MSPTAWVDVTRPAYSTLLTFPLTWTVAPSLRAAAIDRVESLGLGHLAIAVEEDAGGSGAGGDGSSGATTTPTGFLRLPARLGPSRTMQPEQTAAIRLQSMADDFFAVLEELRGDKAYFVSDGDTPTSVDFLAHAYLRTMLVPTPQPFLRKALGASPSHARLLGFAERHNVLGGPPGDESATSLPWETPSPGIAGVLGRFAAGTLDHLPTGSSGLGGAAWTRWRVGGGVRSTEDDGTPDPAHHGGDALRLASATLGGLAAVGAALLFRASPPMGAPTHVFEAVAGGGGGGGGGVERLKDLGAVGAMLGGLSGR